MARKKLIIANWKMNPGTYKEAKSLFDGVKRKASKYKKAVPVVCVPSLYLYPLAKSYSGKALKIGTEDVSAFKGTGSHTGENSADQIKDAGAEYVIVGHSERRKNGEKDDDIRKKTQSAIESKLKVILCVGERKRDKEGAYLGYVARQLTTAFYGAPESVAKNIIIAYEPIWAIGKTENEAITSHDMHQMALFIRKVLLDIFPEKLAHKIPIIYGGSVERGNAEELILHGEIDGFLVGHASLEAGHFNDILMAIEEAGKKK